MATSFDQHNTTSCQGCHKEVTSPLTYRQERRVRFCDDCAKEQQGSIIGVMKREKFCCDKHNEDEAKLYCLTHKIPLCYTCAATAPHAHCAKEEIADIRARQDELRNLSQQGNEKKDEVAGKEKKVNEDYSHMVDHRETLEGQVKKVQKEETKRIDKKKARVKMIHEKANKKIEAINKKRRRDAEQAQKEVEESTRKMQRSETSITAEIRQVKELIKTSTHQKQYQLRECTSAVSDAMVQADDLLHAGDKKCNITDYNDVQGLLSNSLTFDTNVEKIRGMKQAVENIEFKRGKGSTIGRLVWPVWSPNDSWGQPSKKNLGLITQHEVVLTGADSLLVADLNDKTTKVVKIPGIDWKKIVAVAPLPEGRLVAGTRTGNVMIFRSQTSRNDKLITWNHQKTITTKCKPLQLLSSNREGLILAAALRASDIFVYNPKDDKLVKTIPLNGKHIQSRPTMSCLSSGSIVAITDDESDNEVCIVDRSGRIKSTELKFVHSMVVDDTDDSIYCVHFDEPDNSCTVAVVSAKGEVTPAGILSPRSVPRLPLSLVMASQEKLVFLSGSKFDSYKRKSSMKTLLDTLKNYSK